MIDIYWINEGKFELDFENDKDLIGQNREITEQLYAFCMGWA